jgi:hypothetical protein
MFPCVQLAPPCGAVAGQVAAEQVPLTHRLIPAACRSQSLEYVLPLQPQTGSNVGSQLVGLVVQVPVGSTSAQAPGGSSQN